MFRVNLQNLDRLIVKVDRLEKEFGNNILLWKNLRMALREYERFTFANQGGDFRWKFYTESFKKPGDAERYMNWKQRKHPGKAGKLLDASGKLKRSLTQRTPDSHIVMLPRRFEFGSNANNKGFNYGAEIFNNPANPGPQATRLFLHPNPNLNRITNKEINEYAGRKVRRFFK